MTETSSGRDRSDRRPDRDGTKLIGGHFPIATWARLRHLAVDQQRTGQQLIEEALSDLFAKYER